MPNGAATESPVEVHAWYLVVCVAAAAWVELPNTLAMSRYAAGGAMASKPHIASGECVVEEQLLRESPL